MKKYEKCWLTGELVTKEPDVVVSNKEVCKLLDWRSPKLKTLTKNKRKRRKCHKHKIKSQV